MKKRISASSIIGIIILIIAIVFAIFFYYARQYAQIGAGLMAKQMCSCLYVQNRSEGQCLADMNKTIGNYTKQMRILYFPEKVIVSFRGISIAQAKLSPGFGCSVKSFNGQMPNGLNNVPH